MSTSIRDLAEILCHVAGVEPRFEVEPAAVRTDDAPEIRADTTLLQSAIAWRPTIPVETSLRDVLEALEAQMRVDATT
jgi:nucleoside-diphosphate-sugar epimerase